MTGCPHRSCLCRQPGSLKSRQMLDELGFCWAGAAHVQAGGEPTDTVPGGVEGSRKASSALSATVENCPAEVVGHAGSQLTQSGFHLCFNEYY